MTAPAGLRVVVIGTSLGGLTALPVILRALPRGFRCPVVVVQHRAIDADDLSLVAALQRGYGALAELRAAPAWALAFTARSDFYDELIQSELWPFIRRGRVEIDPILMEGLDAI